jgi:hypothetical protein
MAREEAGQSGNAAAGRNVNDIFRQYVRRVYERLHQDFNWPHLYRHQDVVLERGKRYYGFPDDLDPDRLGEVYVLEDEGDQWRDVEYGVGPAQWNRYRHEDGEYADPVRRWQRTGEGLIEVWPTPNTDGQILRFEGMPYPAILAGDSDKIDLDANMVALFAAGEWLAKQGARDAELKLTQAKAIYERLRANQMRSDPVFRLNQTRRRTAYQPIRVRAPGT